MNSVVSLPVLGHMDIPFFWLACYRMCMNEPPATSLLTRTESPWMGVAVRPGSKRAKRIQTQVIGRDFFTSTSPKALQAVVSGLPAASRREGATGRPRPFLCPGKPHLRLLLLRTSGLCKALAQVAIARDAASASPAQAGGAEALHSRFPGARATGCAPSWRPRIRWERRLPAGTLAWASPTGRLEAGAPSAIEASATARPDYEVADLLRSRLAT